MKNKLIDLNNHLFEQIERLNEEDLCGDKLKEEIHRSAAMSKVAGNIIDNAKLALDAKLAIGEKLIETSPEMIGIEHGTNI